MLENLGVAMELVVHLAGAGVGLVDSARALPMDSARKFRCRSGIGGAPGRCGRKNEDSLP